MLLKYTPEQRLIAFWSKVDPCRTDGCAIWLGTRDKRGYGHFGVGYPVMILAHHFLIGKPPKGFEWDHYTCFNQSCIWPAHLELVTHRENVRRHYARQTRCINGHVFDAPNTRITPQGHRLCRQCHRDQERIRYQRKISTQIGLPCSSSPAW